MSGTIDSIAAQYPVKRGANLGATAFVGVLLIGFLFGGLTVGGGVLTSYFMHLWPLLLAGAGDAPVALFVLSLVPVVILLVSGYELASETDLEQTGFRKGATVTVGYAPLALLALGYLLNGAEVGSMEMALGTFLVSDNVVIAFLFTGLLVPAVFGGLGGALADARSS